MSEIPYGPLAHESFAEYKARVAEVCNCKTCVVPDNEYHQRCVLCLERADKDKYHPNWSPRNKQ